MFPCITQQLVGNSDTSRVINSASVKKNFKLELLVSGAFGAIHALRPPYLYLDAPKICFILQKFLLYFLGVSRDETPQPNIQFQVMHRYSLLELEMPQKFEPLLRADELPYPKKDRKKVSDA